MTETGARKHDRVSIEGSVAEVAPVTPPPLAEAPLAGYTVGVTADRRADEQIELLERRGATVMHAPTIRTHPLVDEEALAAATREALSAPVDIAVLITAIGARGWVEAAESLGVADDLLDMLARSELYVRGSKAKGAATTLGLPVTWAAPASSTEVRERLLQRGVKDARIVVQLDGAGTDPSSNRPRATPDRSGVSTGTRRLVTDLQEAGATVIGVPIYRWTFPEDTSPATRLIRAIVDQRVDAVTFTTGTALTQLVAIAEQEGVAAPLLKALNRTTRVVCVGPVCADMARQLGIEELIEPQRARLGSMVYEFASRLEEDRVDLQVGPHRLRMQGRLVVIDDNEPLTLTERERGVLLALTQARGKVLSKTDLLSLVWGPGERDTHLAEVVVARLRQRLAPASGLIETVHRRGYRLGTALLV